jgi:hypothetical protein
LRWSAQSAPHSAHDGQQFRFFFRNLRCLSCHQQELEELDCRAINRDICMMSLIYFCSEDYEIFSFISMILYRGINMWSSICALDINPFTKY